MRAVSRFLRPFSTKILILAGIQNFDTGYLDSQKSHEMILGVVYRCTISVILPYISR